MCSYTPIEMPTTVITPTVLYVVCALGKVTVFIIGPQRIYYEVWIQAELTVQHCSYKIQQTQPVGSKPTNEINVSLCNNKETSNE